MAKIYLDAADAEFTASNSGSEIFGLAGTQVVTLAAGTSGVTVQQSVERMVFNGSTSDFTFLHNGNTIKVYNAAGNQLLSTIAVQGDADGTLLTFTNGTVSAKLTGSVMSLGGTVVDEDEAVTVTPATIDGSVTTPGVTAAVKLNLTTGADEINGDAGNNTFVARIFDNSNSLQSGDIVHGGAGNDTLKAFIGNSQNFAILAETDGVENLVVQAQAISTDSTDNNMSKTNEVQIDAQLLTGVTYFEDNNSRADLLIEDVRLDFVARPNSVTSDVTIAMVATDPGHVDYGVYFDQPSLLAGSSSNSQLALELMDTRSMVNGTGPLKDSPYFKFSFYLDGVFYSVGGAVNGFEIDDAQTYEALLQAVTNAVAANPDLAGKVTVSLGGKFDATDTETRLTFQGDTILLTAANNGSFSDDGPGAGWEANGPVPPSSGLHTNMSTVFDSKSDLITSKIILDHVGRGNMGGDLVVGGLSVGDTDDCKGVEQFDITVIRDSELQTINSTNNKLREVYVVNAANATGDLVVTGTEHTGDNFSAPSLNTTVNDVMNQVYSVAMGTLIGGGSALSFVGELGVNTALPGTEVAIKTPTNTTGDQHNGFGFSDVRVFDASAMVGDVTITAELTDAVVAKFMDRMDNQPNPADDNAQFNYTLGTGNDNLLLAISEQNLVDAGSTNREDFVLNIAGGAGNDQIVTIIESDFVSEPFDSVHMFPGMTTFYGDGDGTEFWYQNSKLNANLNIDAGAGDDFVSTIGAGDFKIQLGTGNDTLYTDNTGLQYYQSRTAPVGPPPLHPAGTLVSDGWKGAQWVFNNNELVVGSDDVNNLLSDANTKTTFVPAVGTDQHFYYKSQLTVTFRGLTSTVNVPNSADYGVSDLQINQAIKDAINNDAVLNKLIVAEDGPANTLVVTSLIDGERLLEDGAFGVLNVSDLAVALTAPAALTSTTTNYITPADVAAYNAAHPTATFLDATTMAAAIAEDVNFFNTVDAIVGGSYGPDFTTDVFGEVNGVDSVNVSDNKITGGAGDDVIVLGTDNAGLTLMDASNDTCIYNALGFGDDTIVNFVPAIVAATAQVGIDYLDFTVIKGDVNAGLTNFTNFGTGVADVNEESMSISILDYETAQAISLSSIEVDIAGLFVANNGTALTHIVIAVDNANVGHVYQVTNPVGLPATAAATAVLAGTIDLADTDWFTLSVGNFL